MRKKAQNLSTSKHNKHCIVRRNRTSQNSHGGIYGVRECVRLDGGVWVMSDGGGKGVYFVGWRCVTYACELDVVVNEWWQFEIEIESRRG